MLIMTTKSRKNEKNTSSIGTQSSTISYLCVQTVLPLPVPSKAAFFDWRLLPFLLLLSRTLCWIKGLDIWIKV